MRNVDKEHALLSASSAHRWLRCTKSARLEEQFPDTSSVAAAEGTLAHALAELKLQHYFFTADMSNQKYTRRLNALKKNELWQDEMEGYTNAYLDYIKSTALAMKAAPYVAIERQVNFSAYVPEGFGTADCIMLSGMDLYVIDFKYGKGVAVGAQDNSQMHLYALGAYEAYKALYPIETIHMVIVQPRLSEEPSEWTCSLKELLAFGEKVREPALLAFVGEGEYKPGEDTCRFCRAKQQCRARSDHNVKQAFDIKELPPLITDEEVGERLKKLKDVAKYQKDLQEYALKQCLAGKEIAGWKAVEGRGSRDWADMDTAFATLTKNGIDDAILWERKPLTLAQVEKVVGKKEFTEMVGDMVVKKPGKPALVEETDKRVAITNKVSAKDAFKEE